nr:hypothetical protein [Rhodococcus wratislaviensis]GLK40862.1 hypothetical protein GCM10017611_77370 [Rhodococcus wratislaviensis]
MTLLPRDEFPHPRPDDTAGHWKDTWWLICRDSDNDVTIQAHLEVAPQDAESVVRSSVVVRHHGAEGSRMEYGTYSDTDSDIFGTDNFTIEVADARWTVDKHLILRGNVEPFDFEIHLRGSFPAADMTEIAPNWHPVDEKTGQELRHVQQAMKFTGALRVDGSATAIEIDGLGIRDRSWGWRVSQAMHRYGWQGAFFQTPEYAGSLSLMNVADDPAVPGNASGWIADANGLQGCSGGEMVTDATGRIARLSLEGVDGVAAAVTTTAQEVAVYFPFHDIEGDEDQMVIGTVEHHMTIVDDRDAAGWGLYSVARPYRSHPMRGANFRTV